jgi:addiction module RelE/StbE family toxin
MRILLHKNFEKNYKKLKESEKRAFKDRRNIFLKNPFDPILNNHALSGKYQGCRSINITGDIRAIYRVLNNEELAYFVTVDTHSNLYK